MIIGNIDPGSIADWVSGIGALLAAIVALGIAVHQHRSSERQRLRLANDELRRHAEIRAEAIRIAGEAEGLARRHVELMSHGGGTFGTSMDEVAGALKSLRAQLEALQGFPMSDPRLFTEIGRIASTLALEPGLASANTSYAVQILVALAKSLREGRERLAGLSNSSDA